MIAFKDKGNSSEGEKFVKKLQKALDALYTEEFEMLDFEQTDLSELLDIVYFNLYMENNDYMNISIKKEKNNSLKFKIEKLK